MEGLGATKLDVLAWVYNPSSWESKAEGLPAWATRLCLKAKKKKKKQPCRSHV